MCVFSILHLATFRSLGSEISILTGSILRNASARLHVDVADRCLIGSSECTSRLNAQKQKYKHKNMCFGSRIGAVTREQGKAVVRGGQISRVVHVSVSTRAAFGVFA